MIDFRYHVVSLVSVFMALAIGVVLGAGPLKEAIGNQLSNEVEGLRRDKTALQQAVANRDQRIAHRDSFISAVAPALVAGQLGGRSVVLVTLPGTTRDVPEALSGQLEAAGATVTGRVDLQNRWVDPGQQEFRKTVAAGQVQYVDPRPPASAGPQGELAAVLARAVLTRDIAQVGQADTNADTIMGALTGGGLVKVEGQPAARASLAVVLAPEPTKAPGAGDDQWTQSTTASVTALLSALDAAGNGTVLAGPLAAAQKSGLLAGVRSGDLASTVSTVDTVDSPMGQVDVVLALREQLADQAGHYGFGDGATAPIPPLPQATATATQGSGG
ncbi:MAG: copper transporter [Actinomycetes bacterium]